MIEKDYSDGTTETIGEITEVEYLDGYLLLTVDGPVDDFYLRFYPGDVEEIRDALDI